MAKLKAKVQRYAKVVTTFLFQPCLAVLSAPGIVVNLRLADFPEALQ